MFFQFYEELIVNETKETKRVEESGPQSEEDVVPPSKKSEEGQEDRGLGEESGHQGVRDGARREK